MSTVAKLHASMLDSSTVDDAAERLLDAVLEHARTSLRSSPFGQSARVLRAMVHLRPRDGYRGLYIKEAGAKAVEGTILSSATTWRWVETTGAIVSVDVTLGELRSADGTMLEKLGGDRGEDGFASRGALLQRAATHLLAIPMRLAGRRIAGLVSIEVRCMPAIGAPSLGLPELDELQLAVDIGATALTSLPLAPAEVETGDPLLPVVGRSMAQLVRTLRVFSTQPETLLILGPTGAGKSRMARFCHTISGRSGPFVAVDLLTLPEDMQMPELFGWRRGSFTGAVDDHQGAVQAAERGTLFLDEIDKLSLKAQAGLLTFLESREVKRMGDTQSHRADVRVVVGSNANLRAAVDEGRFREDLYYRVNVLPVRLPSLDERRDEIPAWAEFMLRERHESGGLGGAVRLTSEASLALAGRRWPGNLRELSNVVRRSYALALVELESAEAGVQVELRHVTSALEMGGASPSDPSVAIRSAALALAETIVKGTGERPRLELAELDALRGAVLEALIGLVEDKEEACRLLGLESQIASRNHSRLLRRELSRWEELQARIRG